MTTRRSWLIYGVLLAIWAVLLGWQAIEHTRGSRRHTQYRLADGTLVPGITTVTGLLDKPGLAVAANRLGLQGIDSGIHWKGLASIGSLAHKLIEHRLKLTDPTTDLRDFTANEIESARKSESKFSQWIAQRQFEYIDSEFQLVSEKHRYGGTGDCFARVNGKLSYVDFKTGGLYLEAEMQGAANAENLIENDRGQVEQFILLGLPRNDEEDFHEKVVAVGERRHELLFLMFLSLRDAYGYRQELESVKKIALRNAANNVVPWEDVQLNAQLRASIIAKGGAPA